MTISTQRWCAWCGAAFLVLFGLGFWAIAGFIPPPSPKESSAQIARLYMDHTNRIRAGLAITMFASTLQFPWVAVISVQLKRIEGAASPMSYAQLVSGGIGFLLFVWPVFIWQTAAFRPQDRDPDMIKMLNDLGWLPFVGIATPAIMQCIAIAVVTLRDRRAIPIFPRWIGWYNIWAALSFLPAAVLPFFKDGPFAWNGLLSLYIPLVAFGVWFILMLWALLRAIDAEEKDLQN